MLAELPVGRVGSLFSCVSSLSFALVLLAAFLFSPPGLSSLSPFLPRDRSSLSSSAAAAHSRELLFGCFITFINAATTMLLLPLAPSWIGRRFLCWSPPRSIVARRKMRILI